MPDESEPPIREFADRGILWLLESAENLKELVRLAAADIADRLDFKRAERVNRSFIPDDLHKQEADLLYHVPFRRGTGEVWVYLLLEHQSRPDRTMGLRLLSYMVQLWEMQRRGWQDAGIPVSQWRLHPIIPIVFYTGKRRWAAPISLTALMDAPALLTRFIPQHETLFLKLQEMASETLTGSAIASAQRYFYDVNGYLILRGIFSPEACRRFIELADRMDADDTCRYKHDGYPKTPLLTVLSRCAWYDPHLLETAMHPVLLPIIEEIIGGEARLEEHQFLINSPSAGEAPDQSVQGQGWHRGIAPGYGSYEAEGRYHCLFTKAFIYLTDNGPGEGTWLVPGSHRMELPTQRLREFLDSSLTMQTEAQAGDVLILSETLVHAGPLLKPGAETRYSLVYGYSAPFMQTWNRYDPPADLLERVTPEQRRLLTGEARYHFRSGQF